MNKQYVRLIQGIIALGSLAPASTQAQIVPDATLPENSLVTSQGDTIQIDGGTTRDSNLFHSFQEFSVPVDTEAIFNNAETIDNILSRVTGGNISEIDGGISANGSANLFLINPAGIIFGEGAFLNVGGSFIGSTADTLLFPDGIEYSATDTQTPPILTINAPIGLSFRDNPGEIVNTSINTDDSGTPDDFDDDDLIGLRVFEDKTLALIGGDVFIDGGFLSTVSGRIELGSVAENSNVSITPIEKGFDFGYGEVANYRDISLSFAALVNNLDANTGDIELQGRNISLIEGSQIGITGEFEGQAGDVNIIASESLKLDGNGAEVDLGNFETLIFHNIFDNATGEGSSINIETPELSITNGAQVATNNDLGNGQGADININASEIIVEKPFLIDDADNPIGSGIFANVFEEGTGDGGNIIITTEKLTLNEGAQIATETFGAGNGGNLTINASDSIELSGTIPDTNDPSALFANVGVPLFSIPSAGNGGNIAIDTPRLIVRNGAQIGSTAQNDGNGGNITINASESVLINGFSPLAEYRGKGISGIFVSTEPSFEDEESGTIIPTTGNGGTLNLTTEELILDQGASISADTFSFGKGGSANININKLLVRDGSEIRAASLLGVDPLDNQRGTAGTLNVDASDSIEVTGTEDINGTLVNSGLLVLAESTGNAGNLNVSANSLDLDQGRLTAATAAGTGGNIDLKIDDTITLKNNSLISAAATGDANGGNFTIDTEFIVAFPSQIEGNGNDIIANAQQGQGGNITINAEALFGITEREAVEENNTNDIDASSKFSLDGTVNINTPDLKPFQKELETNQKIVVPEQTSAQACRSDKEAAAKSGLSITGKGGVPPAPDLPLNSHNIFINGEIADPTASIPQPIETSLGKIQPARGIKVTEDGRVILTAYRTNNRGERLPQGSINCGQV